MKTELMKKKSVYSQDYLTSLSMAHGPADVIMDL